ncbi:MAG: hypothetical protein FNNCIFGK_00791 [Bacteroidia bacterium]|nr:hypothetical protein [Bacteroidia bacterium]
MANIPMEMPSNERSVRNLLALSACHAKDTLSFSSFIKIPNLFTSTKIATCSKHHRYRDAIIFILTNFK